LFKEGVRKREIITSQNLAFLAFRFCQTPVLGLGLGVDFTFGVGIRIREKG